MECSNSAFVIVACTLCGRQHLYDEELERIYADPDDLTTGYFNIDGDSRPCPGCGRADWDFDTLDLDSPQVVDGPWNWVR